MIKITELNKSFDEKVIFRKFDATINNGEFVVFSGKSGCGKTTLLNMIGSIEPIDGGQIIIDDIDVCKRKNRIKLFREVYGFIFQNFALVDNKTVEENLNYILPKYSSGISVEEALDCVGLGGYQQTKIYKLSGGEQQRVALARLLLKKSSVILADEPTGSLDKQNSIEVMNILESIRNAGKTLLMVTHDEELKKRGDRVIELGVGY